MMFYVNMAAKNKYILIQSSLSHVYVHYEDHGLKMNTRLTRFFNPTKKKSVR